MNSVKPAASPYILLGILLGFLAMSAAFFYSSFIHSPADNRAATTSPPDGINPRYTMGIALYEQGKMQEAAAVFAELLSLEKSAAAQYNLAVIYKYHLDKPDEAKALFKQIAASPDADADTTLRAKKELQEE